MYTSTSLHGLITLIVRFLKKHFLEVFVFTLLFCFYSYLSFLSRGGDEWWLIDFAAKGNVLWGDDAYRYFVVRSAWLSADVYWFNFVLPAQVLLDGIVSSVANGNLFFARIIKALILTGSVWLTYGTCLNLGVRKSVALASSLVLGLLPLYFFVGLSFFGESWFLFFFALSMYFHSLQKNKCSQLAASVLPLIRVEGLIVVLGISLLGAVKRDKYQTFIPVALGGLYFLSIITIGPGLNSFTSWRAPMSEVYSATGRWYGGDLSLFWDANPWVWYCLSVLGAAIFLLKKMPAYVIGSALIAVAFIIMAYLKVINFEPRYLTQAMPILPVGLAVLFEWALKRFDRSVYGAFMDVILSLLFFTFFIFNVNTIYVFSTISTYFSNNGSLPKEVIAAPFELSTYFKKLSKDEINNFRELATVTHGMLSARNDIDTLVVSNFLLYYFLDPHLIPPNTKAVFPLFGRRTLDRVLGKNRTGGYFSAPPYYQEFTLSEPKDGVPLLLYIDEFSLEGYPYHWEVEGNDIYLFGGVGETR